MSEEAPIQTHLRGTPRIVNRKKRPMHRPAYRSWKKTAKWLVPLLGGLSTLLIARLREPTRQIDPKSDPGQQISIVIHGSDVEIKVAPGR